MENSKLIELLKGHEIFCKEENNRVLALEASNRDGSECIWKDITGFNIVDINNWMGFEMIAA